MSVGVLLGKFTRGMRNPPYFFKLLNGIITGAKLSGELKNAPEKYDEAAVLNWQKKTASYTIKVTR